MNPHLAARWLSPVLLAALLLACSGDAARAAGPLRFTAIPDANTTSLTAKFTPFAEYLSRTLGVDVEYVPVTSYEASVEAFKAGDIQLAWFGGLTGVQARAAVEGARAVAQGAVDPQYKSYFIAHARTGLSRSDDFPAGLEGRTFTFGAQRSTSGRLMPEFFIREATGRSPEAFFGSPPGFAGTHDQTATLVQNGTFDAGALSYKKYDEMVADGRIDPDVCRIVWVTPTYADYNWTAHPVLEERFGAGFVDRVQRALCDLEDPALLKACLRDDLIPARNEDFEVIAELARELGFL